MEAVVGLFVMLLGVSHGVQTCDGRKNEAQCYGALGGTVVPQLMDDASGIFRFTWSKNKTNILKWNRTTIVYNLIENRSLFTPINGTFRINNLISTDSGQYDLQIFDSNGKLSEQRTLQLTIEAPVSSVRLVSECLSQGQKKVSCSSEGGDSPQYSWTLDGHTLRDTELLSGNNETNVIVLNQNVSGRLVCSVRNHVSRVSKEETISTCVFINCTLSNGTHISQWVFKDTNTLCIEPTTGPTDTTVGKETDITESFKPTTNFTSFNQTKTPGSINGKGVLPIVGGVFSALLIFLLIGVAVFYIQKKPQNNKPQGQDDEQELTYADVRVMQRNERQVRTEEQVEYGQVRFSERPQQTAADACVYAQVRRGR
ncbi:T-cell surface antigen CD2 isoform X1 [Mastacembelus armatus]|uniref:T-cell surface antigen CD2 isoform X1 n=1 Tax=Mastacembelus armatus TaxID=205130 RepID=UPI000E460632|nr:T-cell surface antigen CD2 isoform X1 [Mastacembelus armatus]